LRETAKIDVIGRELRIEKLKTKIEMRQALRFQGTAKQVTITKRAGKYFASILVDTNDYNPNDVNRQNR
jgi:putative transposase